MITSIRSLDQTFTRRRCTSYSCRKCSEEKVVELDPTTVTNSAKDNRGSHSSLWQRNRPSDGQDKSLSAWRILFSAGESAIKIEMMVSLRIAPSDGDNVQNRQTPARAGCRQWSGSGGLITRTIVLVRPRRKPGHRRHPDNLWTLRSNRVCRPAQTRNWNSRSGHQSLP